MTKPRPIPDLSPDVSYGEAAAKIVEVRTEELADHSRGVLDTGDIERVHDMRVATRRLRAALEVFEPCFPRSSYKQTLREVKRLADGLGERRDRDVAIASLRNFNDQMAAPDRRGVSSLIDRLASEQAQANVELAPLVDIQSLTPLRDSLMELAAAAREGGRAEEAERADEAGAEA